LVKETGKQRLDDLHARLDMLQQRLYAESRRSVLVVIQGMDGSGKDGIVRRVFSGLNPQGCRVAAFKVPTTTELAHDYLWRVHALTPARGEIGVFNRSHYEDVVTVRIRELAPEEGWRRRPGHIRDWERLLVDEGTEIVKVFLNVWRDEQRRRFQERVDDPEKRWKFRLEDLDVRRSRRLPRRIRGHDRRDVDGLGSLVRRTRRPELAQGARGRRASLGDAHAHGSAAARTRPGDRGSADRVDQPTSASSSRSTSRATSRA
jgi:hypothetical protein